MTRVAALCLVAFVVASCSDAPLGQGGPGAMCLRTEQCDTTQGLACVGGVCTTDLGPLAEAGMVPPMADGGPQMDAGPRPDGGAGIDSGPVPDSGPPPPTDSGPPPPMDSGPPPPMDSGASGTDGG